MMPAMLLPCLFADAIFARRYDADAYDIAAAISLMTCCRCRLRAILYAADDAAATFSMLTRDTLLMLMPP